MAWLDHGAEFEALEAEHDALRDELARLDAGPFDAAAHAAYLERLRAHRARLRRLLDRLRPADGTGDTGEPGPGRA